MTYVAQAKKAIKSDDISSKIINSLIFWATFFFLKGLGVCVKIYQIIYFILFLLFSVGAIQKFTQKKKRKKEKKTLLEISTSIIFILDTTGWFCLIRWPKSLQLHNLQKVTDSSRYQANAMNMLESLNESCPQEIHHVQTFSSGFTDEIHPNNRSYIHFCRAQSEPRATSTPLGMDIG
jgi:hypothetical protein